MVKPTYRQYFKNTTLKNIEPLKLETNIESKTEFEPRKQIYLILNRTFNKTFTNYTMQKTIQEKIF